MGKNTLCLNSYSLTLLIIRCSVMTLPASFTSGSESLTFSLPLIHLLLPGSCWDLFTASCPVIFLSNSSKIALGVFFNYVASINLTFYALTSCGHYNTLKGRTLNLVTSLLFPFLLFCCCFLFSLLGDLQRPLLMHVNMEVFLNDYCSIICINLECRL